MKLKKVVSLALAGVMAVSMLAGCKYGTPSSSSSSSSEQTATTGVAAAMNAAQGYVEFTDSTSNYLASAVKKATYAQLNDAQVFATTLTYAPASDKVAAELSTSVLPKQMNFANSFTKFTNTTKNSEETHTYLFLLQDSVSEEVAATAVAKTLTSTIANYPATAGGFAATYTGEVSIEKVTKSDEAGDKTASAYYIMVSVTRSLGNISVSGS